MARLDGKVAVVTGASKGIGAAIAKALAKDGAAVVGNYASSQAGADAVVATIVSAGGKAVAVQGDVSKAAQALGLIEAAVERFGPAVAPERALEVAGLGNRGPWKSRALENLVADAVRYGARASVSPASVSPAVCPGTAVVTIEDDGPGIPPGR